MALELLSGPHDIVDINDADAPIPNNGIANWIDPIGLIGHASAGPQTLFLVQMDGSAVFHSNTPYGLVDPALGLTLIGGSVDNPAQGSRWYSAAHASSFDGEYDINRVTHSPGVQLTPYADIPGTYFFDGNYAHLADRWINVSGNSIGAALIGSGSTSWTAEHVLSTGVSGTWYLSWAREPGCIWIANTAGKVVLYDYVSKAEVGSALTLGMACAGLWYSAKHDVFVSRHDAGGGLWQLRVWARTPLPASVSAPVPESAMTAGRVVSLKCRVLGADAEPCVDEVVSWSLTGPGTLLPLTSKTDPSGWARTNYYIPISATGSADIDVQVNV